jgi:ABC-2 type transport system permease protein
MRNLSLLAHLFSNTSLNYWLDFLRAMTVKEIKARYKRAVLGFLWIVINPLSQMLVMGVVFQFFVPVQVDNYFLFLFAGLLPWNFFSQSLLKTTPSFFYERNLIKKARFPREAIVLSIILSNLFHFLIALGLLTLALVVDKWWLEAYSAIELLAYVGRMMWVVPALVLLLMLTVGTSLLGATLNVRFRDVNFIVQLAVMLWLYATPVIYALDLLPKVLQPLFYLNPMTLIIELFHYALMGLSLTLPELWPAAAVIIAVVFYLGLLVFKREEGGFDDWL